MPRRRTTFPNIWLDSLSVETPPFDEPGVIQEFVGRKASNDFEVLRKAGDMSKEAIGERLQSLEELIGPLNDNFRVKYNLIVRVVVDNRFTRRGARIRARTWTRMKNPFEPDVIEVSEPTLNRRLTDREKGTFLNVTVTVTK